MAFWTIIIYKNNIKNVRHALGLPPKPDYERANKIEHFHLRVLVRKTENMPRSSGTAIKVSKTDLFSLIPSHLQRII